MAYKQLTDEKRYQIEALKREGFTQLAIAKKMASVKLICSM
jgi:IS30 family transposase